jgi:hypothetical protein
VLLVAALSTLIVLVLTVNRQVYDSNLFAMAGAQSILSGDLPFRDYFDPGVPLATFTAAGMQWLTGYRLIGEFLRQWAFIVSGVVIAFHLGLQLSRSPAAVVSLLPLTVFLLATEPTYHYAKLFFFPLIVWGGWRYIDRPCALRAAVMGLITAIGFLERHDFGLYLGFASVVALLVAPAAVRSARAAWPFLRDCIAYITAVLVILAPWLAMVHTSEGLLEYARARATLYQGFHPVYGYLFRLDEVADLVHWRLPHRELVAAWLRRLVLLLPVALTASAVTGIVRAWWEVEAPPVHLWKRAFAGLVLAVLAEGLIREATYVVVVLPLSAALACVLLVSRFAAVRAITAALVLVSTVLVVLASTSTPLMQPLRYPDEMAEAFRRLTESPPTYPRLEFEYVRRCTRTTDHILVTGDNPLHVSYFIQRPIAGGQINWHRGWMSDSEHERLALRLLRRQSVPLVIYLHVPAFSNFDAYPNIAAHLRANYREVEGSDGHILVDRRIQPTGRFRQTGYPCFA